MRISRKEADAAEVFWRLIRGSQAASKSNFDTVDVQMLDFGLFFERYAPARWRRETFAREAKQVRLSGRRANDKQTTNYLDARAFILFGGISQ